MKKYLNQKTFNVVLSILLALGGYFGFVADDVQTMGGNWSGTITAENIVATGDMTVGDDLTVTDDLAVTGLATVGETLGVTGAATFSNDASTDDTFNIDENAYALVGTKTITPTATYYQLAPATALTLTLDTSVAADGDLLILQSIVATDTIIADTTCTVGGSSITLGTAGDMAVFLFGNSLWCEVASPDNS